MSRKNMTLESALAEFQEAKNTVNAVNVVRCHVECMLSDPLQFEGYLVDSVTEAAAAADWTAEWLGVELPLDEAERKALIKRLRVDLSALSLVIAHEGEYNEFLTEQLEELLDTHLHLQLEVLAS
jgi:hypothetical protein